MTTNWNEYTVSELRDIAKKMGMEATYKYKKAELVDWLEKEAKELVATKEKTENEEIVLEELGQIGEIDQEEAIFPADINDDFASSSFTADADFPLFNPNNAGEEDDEYHHDLPYTTGPLEVLSDGYGFLRTENEMGESQDYYVSASHIKRFQLRTGDIVEGIVGDNHDKDQYPPVIYINSVNGTSPLTYKNRVDFDDLTPIYADERIRLERKTNDISTRIVDLVAPIGKGQRGLIVSPPKAGKTSLLKAIAHSVEELNPEVYLFIILIDERPEEVTDFERSVNHLRDVDSPIRTEVIASTFDKSAHNHTQTAESLLDRAKRLVESGQDVMILMDSLTRLSRAYNITTSPSGRTLSGGLDPVALYPPKRFFGAARNIDGEGSLTILATCLKDTGSRMDDMIYEEFKGTGNMEVHLSRDLSEMRIFPAIDIFASGTRRDDLLLEPLERRAMYEIRRRGRGPKQEQTYLQFVQLISNTENNKEFCELILRNVKKG